jgi:hypothetical protein
MVPFLLAIGEMRLPALHIAATWTDSGPPIWSGGHRSFVAAAELARDVFPQWPWQHLPPL